MAMAAGTSDLLSIDLLMRARSEGTGVFADMESHLGAIGKGLAAVAGAAVIGGVAIAGAGAVAIKMAADFQSSMTQLVTGAGESESNLHMVSDGILSMAGQVGESTQQLAQGMFMIESAGFHGAAGLQVLQAAAEGARVGNADLQTTANAVTTVMRDYHMAAGQAADATNFLVSVVSQGKTHMQDLAGSLAAVLPTASALHVPLADIGGALATLTARGVPAADAATYLRFTMSALAAETPKGSKALQDIGLTSIDVGNTLTNQGLLPAMQLIEQHLQEKFPQGGAAMFAALKDITGGTRGLGAALGLTGDNLDTFNAAVAKVADQMGGAHGQVIGWSLAQQDFNTKLDQAKGAGEAFAIRIGQMLLPMATQALTVFTGFAGVLTSKVLPAIQNDVIPAVQKAGDWIGSHLVPAAQELAKWFGDHVVPVLKDLGGFVIGTLVPAVEHLWDAFSSKLLPIIKDVAQWFLDHVAPVLVDLASHIIPILVGVLSGLITVLADVLTGAMGVVNWIGQHWPEMIPVFALIAALLLPVAANFVAIQVAAVASAVTSAAQWATSNAEMIAGWVIAQAQAVIQAVATSATWVANAAATTTAWLATKAAMLGAFVETVAQAVIQAAATAGAWVAQAIPAAAAWIGNFVTSMAGAGGSVVATAGVEAGATATAWEGAAAAAEGAFATAYGSIESGAAAASTGVAGAAAGMLADLAPVLIAIGEVTAFRTRPVKPPGGGPTLYLPPGPLSNAYGTPSGATGGKYMGTYLGAAQGGGKYLSEGWIHVGEGATNPEWVINSSQAGSFAPLLDALVFGGASQAAPASGGGGGGSALVPLVGGLSGEGNVTERLDQVIALLRSIAGAQPLSAASAALRTGA